MQSSCISSHVHDFSSRKTGIQSSFDYLFATLQLTLNIVRSGYVVKAHFFVNMSMSILVAYATAHGSTKAIAQRIADRVALQIAPGQVDVRPMDSLAALSSMPP